MVAVRVCLATAKAWEILHHHVCRLITSEHAQVNETKFRPSSSVECSLNACSKELQYSGMLLIWLASSCNRNKPQDRRFGDQGLARPLFTSTIPPQREGVLGPTYLVSAFVPLFSDESSGLISSRSRRRTGHSRSKPVLNAVAYHDSAVAMNKLIPTPVSGRVASDLPCKLSCMCPLRLNRVEQGWRSRCIRPTLGPLCLKLVRVKWRHELAV